MKDKAKSKVLNIVCTAMFIAAGVLYSVSMSDGPGGTVYPLVGSDNKTVSGTENEPSDAKDRGDGASESIQPPQDDERPVSKAFLNGERQFDAVGTAELININSADIDELMRIPGIGPSKADAILKYREENGPFACIEDIMLVPGIKDGTFEKIRAYIEAGS